MIPFPRAILCLAALLSARSLLGDEGNVRVAVVVDMTPEGRKVVHPTPDQPAYYLPVPIGFKQVGGVLTSYQRPPPSTDEVLRLLTKTLADQGYRVATPGSPPSLVLTFRWGNIAPVIVMGQWVNRDEMMTYLVGDQWRSLDVVSSGRPQTDELLANIDEGSVSSSPNGRYGNGGGAPAASGGDVDIKSRYFLLVSALDFKAFQQHKSVLLWRAHVSVNYWGHYLDEALPTLVAAGAPQFGRETNRPQMATASIVPMGHVIVGPPVLAKDFMDKTVTLKFPDKTVTSSDHAFDRLQADTDDTLTRFAQQGRINLMRPPGPAITESERADTPEAPRRETPEGTVTLPPYIVTDSRSPIRWRYASVRGFEILSACNALQTEAFALSIYRQQAWLNEIVPPELRWNGAVPTTLILLSDDVKKDLSEDTALLADTMNRRSPVAGESHRGPAHATLVPQIKLSDGDSIGVDLILNYSLNHLAFDPDYVFSLLANRTPSLPLWFVTGVAKLYQDRADADPRLATLYPPSSGAPQGIGGGALNPFYDEMDAYLYFPPVGEDFPGSDLLPMQQLLIDPPPSARADPDAPERGVWAAQAMLFVRWALDDYTGARRNALWKFVGRASVEPATEAMFRDCFGVGFKQVRRQLSEYLPVAMSRTLALVPRAPLDSPTIGSRDPTETEEARILGDWQRKEIEFLKAAHPDYAEKYATQADHTLMRAYNEGARDPGLLAALGLYECAVGDDDQARGFLEAAVHAQVARPRAYVELARIRLAAALAKPAGAGGRLSRSQVAAVVDLLRAAGPLPPPQLGGFLLAAEAWEHADFVPAPADLQMLDHGLYFFPSDPRLILAAAQLDGAAGLRVDAIRVLDRGLQKVGNPALKSLFMRLRAQYAQE